MFVERVKDEIAEAGANSSYFEHIIGTRVSGLVEGFSNFAQVVVNGCVNEAGWSQVDGLDLGVFCSEDEGAVMDSLALQAYEVSFAEADIINQHRARREVLGDLFAVRS